MTLVPLLAVAAVLAQDRLVLAETGAGRVLREVPLPAAAVAMFVAPDARVVLPLAATDETIVVAPTGATELWRGRVFPIFFDEVDRMHTVLPELLVTASYPERLPILQVPVPGMKAPWRAVSTSNGLMVAICAAPNERRLVLATAEPDTQQPEVRFAGDPTALAMAPRGEWLAVALEKGIQVAFSGEPTARARHDVAGQVRALSVSADGRDLIVGVADGGHGRLTVLRVNVKAADGVKERSSVVLPGPVESVAASGDDVLAVAGEALVVIGKRGRAITRELPIRGARQVAVLPASPSSPLPPWSEATPQ